MRNRNRYNLWNFFLIGANNHFRNQYLALFTSICKWTAQALTLWFVVSDFDERFQIAHRRLISQVFAIAKKETVTTHVWCEKLCWIFCFSSNWCDMLWCNDELMNRLMIEFTQRLFDFQTRLIFRWANLIDFGIVPSTFVGCSGWLTCWYLKIFICSQLWALVDSKYFSGLGPQNLSGPVWNVGTIPKFESQSLMASLFKASSVDRPVACNRFIAFYVHHRAPFSV